MLITFISDTHNLHQKLTSYLLGGDVLVHCGDITTHGTRQELYDSLSWFIKLPYKYKIFIAGNHDICLDKNCKQQTHTIFVEKSELKNWTQGHKIYYLEGDSVEIDNIKFYGHPYTSILGDFAFMRDEENLIRNDSQIPDTTDILITHGPPLGIMDLTTGYEPAGSKSLLKRVKQIKPAIHAFGHIHEGYGMKEDENTLFLNAANHTWLWKGKPNNPPITVDFVKGEKCKVL